MTLIVSLGIEKKVVVSGPVFGRHKLEAYVDAEVCVLPSRYETFPLGLLEAFACGKSVIASSCGGLKEMMIDGETGILVKPGDVPDLSKALFNVLSKKTSETGSRAAKYVEQFSIQKTIDKLELLYDNVAMLKEKR
jgi:glycosyltransferase involved in cell wall biosynthesis